MLRNTGVNVTERRIRHDVRRACACACRCTCECVEAKQARRAWRRYGGVREAACQPRYYSSIPRPVYYNCARSSITSCVHGCDKRVCRRVYLPEEDWPPESTILIRHPRYEERYYPRDESVDIIEPERGHRRHYNDSYYPRRRSSICMGDNCTERSLQSRYRWSYSPRRMFSKHVDRKPVRKVTKKLSPILTCEVTSDVKQRTNDTKSKITHLSKEARRLSLDIYKILSLLKKAEEDDEQFSSVSFLERIHNFESPSSASSADPQGQAKLVTECVQIYPKMGKKRKDPLAKMGNASGVRSKLEALVSALKEYEAERAQEAGSSNNAIAQKYRDVLPSNTPSAQFRSYKNKNEEDKRHKEIVIQTEEPQTSNKSVCNTIKNDDSIEDGKKIKSRLSWKGKDSLGINMKKESVKEKVAVKESEGKKLFFFKKRSKDKTPSEKIEDKKPSKQAMITNRGEVKAGLMIRIGGNGVRKKQFTNEKREKMTTAWIKKYLDSKKDTKDKNIHVRWNNRAFYTKSSTTVVELMNYVYKQMGMNIKSKSDDVSMVKKSSDKKRTKKKMIKTSNTKFPKLSTRRNQQKVEAYMIPETVILGPVYMPLEIANSKKNAKSQNGGKSNTNVSPVEQQTNIPKLPNEYTSNSKNVLNMTNDPSSNFFRIYMPKDFFDSGSKSREEPRNIPSSDEKVYKIVEYETIKSESIHKNVTEDVNCDQDAIKLSLKEDVHRDAMIQVSYASSLLLKKHESRKTIVTRSNLEHRNSKPPIQIQEFVDEETQTQKIQSRSCALAEKFLQDDYTTWIPTGDDTLQRSNCEISDIKKATTQDDKSHSQRPIDPITTPTEYNDTSKTRVVPNDSAEVHKRRMFFTKKAKLSSKVELISIIQWKDKATGSFKAGLLNRRSMKHVTLSFFKSWSLRSMLKRAKCTCCCTEKNPSPGVTSQTSGIRGAQFAYQSQCSPPPQYSVESQYPSVPYIPTQPQYLQDSPTPQAPYPYPSEQAPTTPQYAPQPQYTPTPQQPQPPGLEPQAQYPSVPQPMPQAYAPSAQYPIPQATPDQQYTPSTQYPLSQAAEPQGYASVPLQPPDYSLQADGAPPPQYPPVTQFPSRPTSPTPSERSGALQPQYAQPVNKIPGTVRTELQSQTSQYATEGGYQFLPQYATNAEGKLLPQYAAAQYPPGAPVPPDAQYASGAPVPPEALFAPAQYPSRAPVAPAAQFTPAQNPPGAPVPPEARLASAQNPPGAPVPPEARLAPAQYTPGTPVPPEAQFAPAQYPTGVPVPPAAQYPLLAPVLPEAQFATAQYLPGVQIPPESVLPLQHPSRLSSPDVQVLYAPDSPEPQIAPEYTVPCAYPPGVPAPPGTPVPSMTQLAPEYAVPGAYPPGVPAPPGTPVPSMPQIAPGYAVPGAYPPGVPAPPGTPVPSMPQIAPEYAIPGASPRGVPASPGAPVSMPQLALVYTVPGAYPPKVPAPTRVSVSMPQLTPEYAVPCAYPSGVPAPPGTPVPSMTQLVPEYAVPCAYPPGVPAPPVTPVPSMPQIAPEYAVPCAYPPGVPARPGTPVPSRTQLTSEYAVPGAYPPGVPAPPGTPVPSMPQIAPEYAVSGAYPPGVPAPPGAPVSMPQLALVYTVPGAYPPKVPAPPRASVSMPQLTPEYAVPCAYPPGVPAPPGTPVPSMPQLAPEYAGPGAYPPGVPAPPGTPVPSMPQIAPEYAVPGAYLPRVSAPPGTPSAPRLKSERPVPSKSIAAKKLSVPTRRSHSAAEIENLKAARDLKTEKPSKLKKPSAPRLKSEKPSVDKKPTIPSRPARSAPKIEAEKRKAAKALKPEKPSDLKKPSASGLKSQKPIPSKPSVAKKSLVLTRPSRSAAEVEKLKAATALKPEKPSDLKKPSAPGLKPEEPIPSKPIAAKKPSVPIRPSRSAAEIENLKAAKALKPEKPSELKKPSAPGLKPEETRSPSQVHIPQPLQYPPPARLPQLPQLVQYLSGPQLLPQPQYPSRHPSQLQYPPGPQFQLPPQPQIPFQASLHPPQLQYPSGPRLPSPAQYPPRPQPCAQLPSESQLLPPPQRQYPSGPQLQLAQYPPGVRAKLPSPPTSKIQRPFPTQVPPLSQIQTQPQPPELSKKVTTTEAQTHYPYKICTCDIPNEEPPRSQFESQYPSKHQIFEPSNIQSPFQSQFPSRWQLDCGLQSVLLNSISVQCDKKANFERKLSPTTTEVQTGYEYASALCGSDRICDSCDTLKSSKKLMAHSCVQHPCCELHNSPQPQYVHKPQKTSTSKPHCLSQHSHVPLTSIPPVHSVQLVQLEQELSYNKGSPIRTSTQPKYSSVCCECDPLAEKLKSAGCSQNKGEKEVLSSRKRRGIGLHLKMPPSKKAVQKHSKHIVTKKPSSKCNCCGNCGCGNKCCGNKTTKNENEIYVTQMFTIGKNSYSSNRACINLDSNASDVHLRVMQGNNVTKICIRNEDESNNVKHIKIIDHPNIQDPNFAKDDLKIYISITNTNYKEVDASETEIADHFFDDEFSKKVFDEFHRVTTGYSNIEPYESKDIPSIQRSVSAPTGHCEDETPYMQSDDIVHPACIIEPTHNKKTVKELKEAEFRDIIPLNANPSTDSSHIVLENYVNKLLGTADNIDRRNLKKVVEIKSMLQAIITLDAGAGCLADMAATNSQVNKDNTITCASLEPQTLRPNEIVNIFNKVRIRNNNTDSSKEPVDISDDENYDEKSESSGSCCMNNIIAKGLNVCTPHGCCRQRVEMHVQADYNVNAEGDIAANYSTSHLVNRVTRQCSVTSNKARTELCFTCKSSVIKTKSIFKNSDTVIGKHNASTASQISKSKVLSSRKKSITTKVKCTCSNSVKKVNMKKTTKKGLMKEIQNNSATESSSDTCEDKAIILANMEPSKAGRKPGAVHKRTEEPTIKTDAQTTKSDHPKLANEFNADVLQSDKVKKAVLQIYTEGADDNNYLMAKIPKYLHL